jgi:hypothetical protein
LLWGVCGFGVLQKAERKPPSRLSFRKVFRGEQACASQNLNK